MGLLDDAIRDHLELKRRRGADPSEIAREEREALEPVFPDEPRPAALDGEPQAAGVLDGEPPHGDPLHDAAATAEPPADPVAAQAFGEETAEFDMQSVLEEEIPELDDAAVDGADSGATATPVAAEPFAAGGPSSSEALGPPPDGEEDLLEWEVPGGADAEAPPEPLPGQESMSFE
jgi:hypothetical protein